jgi:hypothetical protein
MSIHGATGVGRWALGSVTERVVRHSDTAVLVVRAKRGSSRSELSGVVGSASGDFSLVRTSFPTILYLLAVFLRNYVLNGTTYAHQALRRP